jgi:hypothetical protein
MPHLNPVVLAVAVLLTASTAFADTHAVAPSGGGLAAVDVKVDLARGVVGVDGVDLAIPIDRARIPPEGDVTVESVAIGQGKHVVHVRVPVRDAGEGGSAWEAIFAAGRKDPVFAAMTGPVDGDPGERSGKAVQIVPNGATSFVLVGDTREDVRICGQTTTLLDPLALYPGSLELRPATVQRLSAEQQNDAEKITAVDKGATFDAPLAQLLVARASSVPESRGAELTDRNLQTVWREHRPGIGQGEFVVMSAPKAVPITRMQVVVAPPNAAGTTSGAGPKTFYLVTSTGAFEVTIPGDGWAKPGETYEVVFPHPVETSCLALVLDSAYSRGLAHPDVGVAEVAAFSEFDAPGATLDDVAKRLSSERGIAAAQVLERAGGGALAAVANAYDALDARGRALAMDVAASHEECDAAGPLLARGLCEPTGQAHRKAREKLERCKGAAPSLVQRMREDAASRACIAPLLATMAPEQALEPIADALAEAQEDDHGTRAALRAAFSSALAASPRRPLGALLGDPHRSASGRLELMRAAETRVGEAPAESEATVAELLSGSPTLRMRYLVLGPLSELARGGDRAAAARLADAVVRDPDGRVRARAAELGVGLPDVTAALVRAAEDPEPRVREAALGSLAPAAVPDAARLGVDTLAHDGWWFVKVQAVAVLMNVPGSAAVDDALGDALHDPSVKVRAGALLALARHRAVSSRDAVRERLDDPGEDPQVRASAAGALGALCDADSADRLTELARALASPTTDDDAQQLGFAALFGLAALQPHDLRDRIAPLLASSAPAYARNAAGKALAARPMCEDSGKGTVRPIKR